LLPGVPQVAVFDTAFHQTIPDHAYIYGLPYKYYTHWGVRKYGFHGTSHEYVAQEAARILKKPLNALKIITCHLGNGCSIAAVKYGKSVDTSMGFTPLEGLVMGTRCGDIDPASVIFLAEKEKISLEEIDKVLNYRSGLKGISGLSNDMREIKKAAKAGHVRARLALEIFIYRIKKYIGSYIAALGGVDAIVFTAGIGENEKDIRAKVVKGLFGFLSPKKTKILVVETNEELMIAKQTFQLVR
jgi:acetate kinase